MLLLGLQRTGAAAAAWELLPPLLLIDVCSCPAAAGCCCIDTESAPFADSHCAALSLIVAAADWAEHDLRCCCCSFPLDRLSGV
jgi:hypothetical protein